MSALCVTMDDKTPSNTSDPKFLHAAARFLTGNVVDVRTQENEIIRGVFGGMSGLTFSIDKPARMDSQKQKYVSTCPSPLVLHSCDVIEIFVSEVDKDEVIQSNNNCEDSANSHNNLRTDSEIALESRVRPNGAHAHQVDDGIHLTPFYAEGSEPKDLEGLELNGEDGWTPKQMFSTNEALGVPSSYDPSLAEYTTELVKEDTVEYREREARASALAAEIEGNTDSKAMADRENDDGADDDTEEMRFSAVQRQAHQGGPTRTGGRLSHNDRPPPHVGPRNAGPQASSQPIRNMGRGRSHSYRPAPGSSNVGPGANTGPQQRTAELLDFSKRFNLQAKNSQPPPPGSQPPQTGPSHLSSPGGPPGRKDLSASKNVSRSKRAFPQSQQPSGPRSAKSDDALVGAQPSFNTNEAETPSTESRSSYSANRRPSEAEKPSGREETTKPKMDEKSPTEAPKAVPSASPGATKDSPVDSDAPSLSTEPSTGAAAQSTGSSHAESPAACDGDKTAEPPADAEAATVASKSTLNIDAKPFYPRNASMYSADSYPAPSNVPIQSPPAAPMPSIGVHPRPNAGAGPVTMTHNPVFLPQIGTPLPNQPIPGSALSHIPPTGGEVISGGTSLPPHPPPMVLHPTVINSSNRYASIPAVGHPNVPSPSQMIPPYTAASLHPSHPGHTVVSQGVGVPQSMQGAPPVSMAGHTLSRMNSNGGNKRAVVSVNSTVAGSAPAGINHRNTSSEMQAAAMTGAPLVAPAQGGPPHTPGHSMGHHPQAHGSQMYQAPYYPAQYAPAGPTMPPNREANGQPGVPAGNTSQPPTPSSTPQQQFAIAHGGHPAYQAAYLLPQQMPQGGPPHHLFPQHVSVTHSYSHHGQHMQAGGQPLGPGAASMMAGHPPGAVQLYHVHLGHQQVQHQQAQQHHAAQQHHGPQQQQQQSQQSQQHQIMAMAAIGQLQSSAMYQPHPPHQHHQQSSQHQQQHAGPAPLPVGPGAGGPGLHVSPFQSLHGHGHAMTPMSYPQPGAAGYMQQPQHAGVTAGAQHVSQ